MGRAYAQHVARQEAAARQKEMEEYAEANKTYYNPVIHSGYDPDGLNELFGEDDIDWDAFDWDIWNWVVVPDEPAEGETQSGEVTVGSIADGAEINFDYYRGDPLYQIMMGGAGGAYADLFSNYETYYTLLKDFIQQHSIIKGIDIDIEDLKEATRYVVETYKMAANNEGYREPWKDPLPEAYKPTRLKTDYKTPFDIPGIVAPAPGAQMSERLKGLQSRTVDATNFKMHEMKMAALGTQQGYQQPKDPNWTSDSWRPAGHPDHDQERTGIGGQYVLDEIKRGQTIRQIKRKAENKGWTIGPHAQSILDGQADIK